MCPSVSPKSCARHDKRIAKLDRRLSPHAVDAYERRTVGQKEVRHDLAFRVGDCAFLVLIGYLAAAAMQWARDLGWSTPSSFITGMVLAMCIQIALSFLVAPVLGSIESMVPSMVVAMVVPMLLDGAEMIGLELEAPTARYAGGLLGLMGFLALTVYSARCRRYFELNYGGP